MKKIIAFFMAITLMFVLCACGNSKSETKNDSNNQSSKVETKNETSHAIGDTLSEPEKLFDAENTDKLYLRFITVIDEKTNEFEYAFDQITDDTYIMYATDGMLKNNEIVYEVGDNEIKKYSKNVFEDKFTLTSTTYDELKKEVDEHMALCNMFLNGLKSFGNFKYVKKSDLNVPGVGDAYVYDVFENDEKVAEVMVDKDSGLYAKIKMEDGSTSYSLSEYKLSGYKIPEYK